MLLIVLFFTLILLVFDKDFRNVFYDFLVKGVRKNMDKIAALVATITLVITILGGAVVASAQISPTATSTPSPTITTTPTASPSPTTTVPGGAPRTGHGL